MVRTRRRVVLTSMRISKYDWERRVDIWLMTRSIMVGRKVVIMLLVRGLPSVISTIIPFWPGINWSQKLISLKKYWRSSLAPEY